MTRSIRLPRRGGGLLVHDAVFAFEGRGNLLEVVVGAIDGAEDKDGVVPSGKVPWRPS
jgi:hypothetical protein